MSIVLHPKHGANPTITTCYYCGGDSDILLVGVHTRKFKEAGVSVSPDGQMPIRIGPIGMRPCRECEKYMEQGVILISVENNTKQEEMPDPRRTGCFCVVTEDCIRRLFIDNEMLDFVLKHRFMFIVDNAWDTIGLPRENFKQEEKNASKC